MRTTTRRSPHLSSRHAGWLAAGLTCLIGGMLVFGLPRPAEADLSPELQEALDTSKYVYIQSERKSGAFGSKAEIWFLHHDGAVWVGTPKSTYRVKRIQAGRTNAKVWIGSADGPMFDAVGELVQDDEVTERMFQTFAEKYPDGWPTYEEGFRSGFADGSRTLVRYAPAPAE